MMLIFLVSFLSLVDATAFESKGDYFKMKFYGTVVDPSDGAGNRVCTGTVAGQVLIRILPTIVAASGSAVTWDMAGACVNINGTDMQRTFDKARTEFSFGVYHDTSNSNLIRPVHFTGGECKLVGAALHTATGWKTTGDGNQACGGLVAGTPTDGVALVAAGDKGLQSHGTQFVNKKFFAAQLVGPFSDANCKTSSTDASANTFANDAKSYPVIVPLGDATATLAPDSEVAVTTTGQCADFGHTGTADNFFLLRAKITATKGELVITVSKGTGTVMTSRTVCTDATTIDGSYKWAIGERGNLGTCVRGSTVDGGDFAASPASTWFQLYPAYMSIGDYPNNLDVTCPACPSSPASPASRHLPTFMVGVVALIAMML